MQPILNIAIAAARNASRVIVRSIGRLDAHQISEKDKNDFVTEVDKAAEKEIIQTLKKTYPDHKFIAEESGVQEGNEDFTWIIDPLDGTTNFIHGIPHFAISIAFQYKGKMEHGVIYDPIRNELFVASRGEGARLNDRRIRVSSNIKIERSLLGTGFPFKNLHHIPLYMKIFEHILPQVSGIRRAGSAALDLAYVAAGRFDGFWELGLQQWDMAAGVLMIKEAGGLVCDFSGEENYLSQGDLIAGNPKVFKGLLQMIHPIAQTYLK
ncbi:MAG: inositol monophosphatase [Gammaproteobacteria bacterium]|nr:inositol monophosphatase [Gammaproteobacteria bacterium]